jgi:putative ABC transport system substrate-binding protein
MVPRLVRVAVLSNPAIPFRALDLSALGAAAQSLKVELQVLEARAPSEFDAVFSTMTSKRAGALVVLGGSMFFAHRATLGRLAAKSRLPAMYGAREYVEAGGLMAYSPNGRESFRRAAGYVDRILKGAKPGDLPVEQPTAFDLVVNRKAAKALGLSIPASVLALAEQVIE